MAIARVITAQKNDTLCGIAVRHGFRNCTKLRAENPQFQTRPLQAGDTVNIPEVTQKSETGATETRHRFRRPGAPTPSIRFVHGSATLPFANDPTLRRLNVSRYVTDRAGAADGAAAWVDENTRAFEANADQDPDTFKVEVHDVHSTQDDLVVNLRALKPVYDPADPRGRRILRHEAFAGAELARRSLENLAASRQGGTDRFRSCYLRLVVDDADKNSNVGPLPGGTFPPQAGHAGRPRQTLLVTDMFDEGDPEVEILDQLVEATYDIDTCPAAADVRCRVRAEAPLGEDRRRMRMVVHILRQTPGGAPVVTVENVRRRVLRWFRRVYAQASIAPELIEVHEVDPVENVIAVSEAPTGGGANAGGANASGVDGGGAASQLGFRINAAGQPSQVIGPITPAAGSTPIQTARRLAGLVSAPYTAVATANPPRFTDVRGSADIVIKHTGGGFVTIDQLQSTDTAQRIQVGSVNPLPAQLQDWSDRFLGGSLDQRVLLKNYDTGADRIDMFVVPAFTNGDRGEAMMSGHDVVADASRRAGDEVKFSVFMITNTMDGTDNDPMVLAHEVGHVAAELGHTPANVFQLMCDAVTGNADTGGSKRLRNGNAVYNITTGTHNINSRLRSEGGGLMEAW